MTLTTKKTLKITGKVYDVLPPSDDNWGKSLKKKIFILLKRSMKDDKIYRNSYFQRNQSDKS